MNQLRSARSCIVFDFETTGLSPDQGDRAIEIGAVRLENGAVVDQFQALMNPGRAISPFIEEYTGISNAMLESAAPCEEVMGRFAEFSRGQNLVAHNASFDQRFLKAELARLNKKHEGAIACSMLAARRLVQDAPNHKLGTLVHHLSLNNDGTFHRALADAKMTASLWVHLIEGLAMQGLGELQFSDMTRLCKTSKKQVSHFIARLASS